MNKKKKEGKAKKPPLELEPDDFDMLTPGEMISADMDEVLMDPSMVSMMLGLVIKGVKKIFLIVSTIGKKYL